MIGVTFKISCAKATIAPVLNWLLPGVALASQYVRLDVALVEQKIANKDLFIKLFGFTWIQMRLYKKFALPSRNRAFFQSIHNLRESRHWSVVLIAQSCLNLINLKNGHTCQAVFHFIIMSVMFLPLLPFTWNIPLKELRPFDFLLKWCDILAKFCPVYFFLKFNLSTLPK